MEELDIKKVLNMLWQGKFIIIAFIVLGVMCGYIYNAKLTNPLYKSSSSIILSVAEQDLTDLIAENEKTISSADISLSEQLMNTYAEIIKSESVINKVIENLGLNIKTKQLQSQLTVTPNSKSTVIKISVKATSPKLAANIVNEIDKVFLERIDELYNIKSAKVLDAPTIENAPININPKKYAIIGAALGFILSSTFLIVKECFNDKIKSDDDVEKQLKLHTLAKIDHFSSRTGLVILKEGEIYSDIFRSMVSDIKNVNTKSILITSNVPEEGKSVISANLALTLAISGKKTLLIDSDMRKGTQHLIFGLKNKIGLSNLLQDDNENYQRYLYDGVTENLDILTKGTANLNYSKLLFSNTIEKIINLAKEEYDYIVVDGTPSKLVADGTIMYKLIDSTIIVAKYNTTTFSDANKIKKSIKKNGGSILGVIINDIPKSVERRKRYAYYGKNMMMTTKAKRVKN